MAILMGITWIVGFIASFLDNEILWWVFILTNSLHGIFLCLITLCKVNRRGKKNGEQSGKQEHTPMRDLSKNNNIENSAQTEHT